jgi:hypothetical protein
MANSGNSWTSDFSGQRGRREKWPGESENGRIRAPAGNHEVHRNPHEPAPTRGSTQKKTNPIRGWSSCLVGPQGLEPWTKGLCLPLRLSPPLSSLWSGLYLPVTGWPSSLYTFPRVAWGIWLGIGISQGSELPPNLTSSTRHQNCTGNEQPMRATTLRKMFRLPSLSPLL